MAKRKGPNRKILRVDFRQNRQVRRRADEWTQRYHASDGEIDDAQRNESIRAKGELSRKRTIIVDEHNLPIVDESAWLSGVVTKVHGHFCCVHVSGGATWECTVRRVLRTRSIAGRSPVTVGDRAWFSDHARLHGGRPVGVIERIAERTTRLSRRDRRQREHILVANADRLLAVVSVAQPRLRPHLVDRYLVAAEKGGLEPLLCFNKIDLLAPDTRTEDDDERQGGLEVTEVIEEFRQLGYRCLCTSVVTGAGIHELGELLRDHITVLSGQSGVGKSSLINAVDPGLHLTTQTVSTENEKGRHTTTLAELLPLAGGGYVVDTPGIRAFDLWGVARGELEACFREFVPLVPRCGFSNCAHRDEDGCAILAAVEAGVISARRYYSYLKMLEEV